MKNKYDHIYSKLANQSLPWLIMDTEELYHRNLKNRRKDLKRNGWLDSHFTYDFNSLGFRCDEFTPDSSIMFLGCSHTIGIGLPLENIWPELVSKALNLKCSNLGIGGGSLDTAFRLCHGYIDIVKPKIVVLMKPPGYRIEVLKKDSMQVCGVWDDPLSPYFLDLLENEYNEYFQNEKNILAIKNLCRERNIKFILTDSDQHRVFDLARDLRHFGKLTHKNMSETIINQINSTI